MGAFVLLVTFAGALKLSRGLTNGLDLAIYQQVFWQTSHGVPFGFTIHPHAYLGDHAEFAIVPLSLLFRILGSTPLALITLQAVALALGALPLYRIAVRRLGPAVALAISVGYLIQPLVWNAALFEFHLLPFAVPLVFMAIEAYLGRRFWPFVLWVVAASTMREDVALVGLGFAVLALLERRPVRWWLPVGLGSLGWVMAALAVTRFFNPDGTYKFLAFYHALGDTPLAVLLSPFLRPVAFVQSVFSVDNLLLLAGLLLPFGLLPLAAPRFLIPTTFIAAQLFLPAFSPDVVLLSHYPSLLLPFLFLATIEGIRRIREGTGWTSRIRWVARLLQDRTIAAVLIIVVWIYSSVTLGPVVPLLQEARRNPGPERVLRAEALAQVPTDAGVVASYNVLTDVASRPAVASLHYVFQGHRQYSEVPYELPADTNTVVMDTRDALWYQLQYETSSDGPEVFRTGDDRLRELLKSYRLTWAAGRYRVYTKDGASSLTAYETAVELPTWATAAPVAVAPTIQFRGSRVGAPQRIADVPIYPLDIAWQGTGTTDETYQVQLRFLPNQPLNQSTILPFADGLYPTHEITDGQVVITHAWLPFSSGTETLELQLVKISGALGIVGTRAVGEIKLYAESVGEPAMIHFPQEDITPLTR